MSFIVEEQVYVGSMPLPTGLLTCCSYPPMLVLIDATLSKPEMGEGL